jgi:hypothetical protein
MPTMPPRGQAMPSGGVVQKPPPGERPTRRGASVCYREKLTRPLSSIGALFRRCWRHVRTSGEVGPWPHLQRDLAVSANFRPCRRRGALTGR